MRTLPILIEPVAGETISGYIGRLAQGHCIDIADVRRVLLRDTARSAWSETDPRVVESLARMAGLPWGALDVSFEEHGMWVRCGHRHWRAQKCERCRRFAEPRPACRICSRGLATGTVAEGGALCIEHGRWSYGTFELDIPNAWGYEDAERDLARVLWPRGVTLHTGELQLAAALIVAAMDGDEVAIVRFRAARLGLRAPQTFDEVLVSGYPEVVRIAVLLTDRAFVNPLLKVSTSSLKQADRLAATAARALNYQDASDALRNLSRRIVGHAHGAVIYAEGLRRTRSAKQVLCPRDRALVVAADRRRACLLRHASAGIVGNRNRPRSDGTPRPRVTRNHPLMPDELALQ